MLHTTYWTEWKRWMYDVCVMIRFRRTNGLRKRKGCFWIFIRTPCFSWTNKKLCEKDFSLFGNSSWKDFSLFLSISVCRTLSLLHVTGFLLAFRTHRRHHHNHDHHHNQRWRRRRQLQLTSTTKYSVCPVSSRTAANRFCWPAGAVVETHSRGPLTVLALRMLARPTPTFRAPTSYLQLINNNAGWHYFICHANDTRSFSSSGNGGGRRRESERGEVIREILTGKNDKRFCFRLRDMGREPRRRLR